MVSLERVKNIGLLALTYLQIQLYTFLYAGYMLITGKGNPYKLIHLCAEILDPRYICVKGSHKVNGGKTMYFVNHRSWADFFVDGDMISGCSYLSRMAVIFAFPPACLCGYLNQFIWFFKRQRGISRDWFTSFFEKNWAVRNDKGVIVYPEGHRYKGEGSLKLKTGVMEVAYNMKTPCQIVISKGKENLMDEVSLKIHKQSLITIYVSEVMDPTKFETKEEWFEFVNKQWMVAYEKLEKGEVEGKPFFGPLPGIAEESLVDEPCPRERYMTSLYYTGGVIAIIAVLSLILKKLF